MKTLCDYINENIEDIKVGDKFYSNKNDNYLYITYSYRNEYTYVLIDKEGNVKKTFNGRTDKVLEYITDNGYEKYEGKIKYKKVSMLSGEESVVKV